MFTILLHSSKTMRTSSVKLVGATYQPPRLLPKAKRLASYVQSLSPQQLARHMQLSQKMSTDVHHLWQNFSLKAELQLPAIDSFLGDIYSGLQVDSLTPSDRQYANQHLLILSGLYGGLKALDSIHTYRLEMGYRFPDKPYQNIYKFWGSDIAKLIPGGRTIINLSAVEYTKTILPHLLDSTIITPKFMTVDSITNQPKFVTVHAKIARGAYANWLIKQRVDTLDNLKQFDKLGYKYDVSLSAETKPVFITKQFQGLGLSVRQRKN